MNDSHSRRGWVVSGPYRWVRHPVYVGFHRVVVGAGLVIGSAGLTVVVGAALLPAWVAYLNARPNAR